MPPIEHPNTDKPVFWRPLRHRDQGVLAAVIAVCLTAITAHWVARGGPQAHLIEVQRILPGTVAYQVDLNEAEWIEFTILPGVGETLARRIVASRTEAGPFTSIDDLARVNGIGPRTVERLRPYFRPFPAREATAERSGSAAKQPW